MRGILTALLIAIGVTAAQAQPAVVYSLGNKFDGSFNESAFRGVEAWEVENATGVDQYEPSGMPDLVQGLRRFARNGNDPIVAVGFFHAQPVTEVARQFPDARFTILDAVAEGDNVQSIVYREHEGAYLAGVMAALASESRTIGMIGGMDIPLIRRFACGYAQGAKSVRPDVRVLVTMTGDTADAWSNPARGAELTRQQIGQGADVIMQAAGGTGLGVLAAAAEAGVLGIGTDSNQNPLHPGQVLTSVRKRLDVAVQRAFDDWTPGIVSLGLADGGVDVIVDDNNAPLISDAMMAAVEAATRGIVSGAITVHDSATEGPCPHL